MNFLYKDVSREYNGVMNKSILGFVNLQKVGAVMSVITLVTTLFTPFFVGVPKTSAASNLYVENFDSPDSSGLSNINWTNFSGASNGSRVLTSNDGLAIGVGGSGRGLLMEGSGSHGNDPDDSGQREISTKGYDSLTVQYSRIIGGFTSGDSFVSQYALDDGSFVTLETLTVDQAHSLSPVFSISNANRHSKLTLRFFVNGSSSSAEAGVDNLVVTGDNSPLFYDGFESNSFTVGGWTTAGSPDTSDGSGKYWTDNNDSNKGHAANLDGGSSGSSQDIITKQIDTTGYEDIHIRYARRVDNMSSGENLKLQYSVDGGSNWVTLHGSENVSYSSVSDVDGSFSALPPSASDNASFMIRFWVDANSTNDDAFIDDVIVWGTLKTDDTTTTSVNCDPVDFGSSTTCTTTVTNTSDSSTPTGSVTFSTSGTGNFTPLTSCTLSGSSATSSCSVTYEPTTYNSGSQTITADYGGDSGFSSSTGNTSLIINDVNDPVITLVGSSTINLNKGDTYTEQGATASDTEDGDLTGSITSSTAPSAVDTNTPGTYVITYSVSDNASHTASTTRTVNISDPGAPVFDPISDVTVEATGPAGATTTYPTLTATDDVDASSSLIIACNPTSGSLFALGTTTVSCTATDSSSSVGYASFYVAVQDTTAPTITLNGSSTVSLLVGDDYTELGATVDDLVDGTSTATIGGDTVTTSTAGIYVVTYNATDTAGNAATEVTRTVMVNLATTTLTIDVVSGAPVGAGATVDVNGATSTYVSPIELNNNDVFNTTANIVIGYAVNTSGTCSGTATAGGPYTCSLEYVSSSFDIISSAGANGSISPLGTSTVPQWDDQTFTITPDSGFQVADVLVDGVSVGGVTTYTFSSVVASHTIEVSFSAIPTTPSGGGGGGGGSVTLVPASNPAPTGGENTGGGTTGGGETGTGGGTETGTTGGGTTGGTTGGGTTPTGNTGGTTGGGITGAGSGTTGGGGGTTGGNTETGGGAESGNTAENQLANVAETPEQATLLASILDTLGGNMNLLILLLITFGIIGLLYYFNRED